MVPRFIRQFFCILILISSFLIYAQENDDGVTFGKYLKLHSEILKEDRTLLVYLPRRYDQTKKKYPVIVQLDGWESQYLRGIASIERLRGEEKIPEAIYVAIANTDRDRDMLPFQTVFHRTGGGADRFIRFLTEEVFSFVNDRYRITSYKVLIGFSNSGLFTIYTLATRPESFDAYVACSPSIAWRYDFFKEKMVRLFDQRQILNKSLSIVYGGREGNEYYGDQYYYNMSCVLNLTDLLKSRAPKGFYWNMKVIEEGRHVPYGCIYEGLKAIFHHWEPVIQPEIIPSGGFLKRGESVEVTLLCKKGTIHYTLDGTDPTRASTIYDSEIIINESMILKAKVYYENIDESRVASARFEPSSSLKPDNVQGLKKGISYNYYEDYYWYTLPDFNMLQPKGSGIVERFHLKARQREEGFAFRFKGFIDIPRMGVYRFYLKSNDESKLQIGEKTVIHRLPQYPLVEKCGQIVLEKGKHPIVVEYVGPPFRRSLELKVMLEGPDLRKQEIPEDMLYSME